MNIYQVMELEKNAFSSDTLFLIFMGTMLRCILHI